MSERQKFQEILDQIRSEITLLKETLFRELAKKVQPYSYYVDEKTRNWTDLKGFHAAIAKKGTAVNHATLVGQGTVRSLAMGENQREERRQLHHVVIWRCRPLAPRSRFWQS